MSIFYQYDSINIMNFNIIIICIIFFSIFLLSLLLFILTIDNNVSTINSNSDSITIVAVIDLHINIANIIIMYSSLILAWGWTLKFHTYYEPPGNGGTLVSKFKIYRSI